MATAKDKINQLMQSWRKEGNNLVSSHQQLRQALLNHPAIQSALANYINQLNLQGQINQGHLTENQALKLFHESTKRFLRDINTHINTKLTEHQNNPALNQTDLSNPINMQNQLNNPGSFANEMMNNMAAAITSDIDEQAQSLQTQNQQEENTERAEDAEKSQASNNDDNDDQNNNSN